MLLISNTSSHTLSSLLLAGIPGLDQEGGLWTSIIFCIVYIFAVLGNFSISYIIWAEKSLHGPMYFFLAMLAINDIAFSSSTVPKMLGIFWWSDGRIDVTSCLTQMFFVHFLSMMESGILVAMAYDRYIAICFPLRYMSILTYVVLEKIAASILVRAIVMVVPIPFMVARLHYCGDDVVLHSYCDHMAVVNMACDDKEADSMYGIIVALSIVSGDLLLIGLSYTMILRAVYKMPSKDARKKALGTCVSHICVIIILYTPALFSFIGYRFGQNILPHNVHIFLSNVYILFPAFMNPLIYGVRTKQVRECVLKMVTHNRKTQRPK
ncbi:olfactory receptor 52K1-like [Dendropsophus ebraccatus]|uniref:olfactory receptor 52K1-like n=1 Tax=Dendropsophus ebraccatus TaxID=150705 RepID=UPI003831B4F3